MGIRDRIFGSKRNLGPGVTPPSEIKGSGSTPNPPTGGPGAASESEAPAAGTLRPAPTAESGPLLTPVNEAAAEALRADLRRHQEEVDVSPVGLGIALLGALLTVIALFLPHLEGSTFARIKENTLIQNGDGWILIGLATGVAASAYAAYRRNRKSWAVIILGVVIVAFAVYHGTDKDSRTLVSVNPPTEIDSQDDLFGLNDTLKELSKPEVADPGIGVYMVGVGGLLAILGGWQIRRSGPLVPKHVDGEVPATTGQPTKTCPDCAERVLNAARVCKHCGYRFDAHGPP